jgi:hypothetical protein
MKQHQLNELIRHITHIVLEELGTPLGSSLSGKDDKSTSDSTPPVDDMTPAEKARHNREAEMSRRAKMKAKGDEIKLAKKEKEFQKEKVRQLDQNLPNLNKDLQQLKGAKI